jgi:radical SAM family uncharacterized protein/radical SAM-linked protein
MEVRMKRAKDWKDILKRVERPGRYLGGEWNQIRKDPQSVKLKIALVFPDIYEIGMSYLGQKILYEILNKHPSFLAERVFAPWVDLEKELRSEGIPLFSLENRLPLFRFDIIGFSLLYELNYTNILTILDLGQIPLFFSERKEESPLVIAGGPAAFNPEPVADIFDIFLIGDGEEALVEIAEKYVELKENGLEKSDLLKEMVKIKGIYVPALYTPYRTSESSLLAVKALRDAPSKIEKRVHFSFERTPFPEKIVVPNVKIVFDRVGVEVERGCPQKCRFCQATSIYFPPRPKTPSQVLQNVLGSLNQTGYEDASLAALSISDYPYLEDVVKVLMENLEERKISLSLPSLRPKGLTSDIARSIIRVKKTGLTLVPEAGTERLRRVINKDFQDRDIYEAAENAFSLGWRLLKLYFMIGLPTEEEEDLAGIVAMVKEIIRMGYKLLKSPPRINLSISSFIPKPHTPFQWWAMEEEKVLRKKHEFIKSRLKRYPFVKFNDNSLKSSLIEGVISRGDRQITPVLLQAWKRGARFDSWKDRFRFQTWTEAFQIQEIDYHRYLETRKKEEILPWDHIDLGIHKSYLWKELEKALKEETTPSCVELSCQKCRGCSFPAWVNRKPNGEIKEPSVSSPRLGRTTDHAIRYRAFYSKSQDARYISHIDMNNVIKRGFRRAGIFIVHSKGYHPKMNLSYLPALPLGMEGKREALEFKSQYLFQEKAFINRLNAYLPPGIKFLRLQRLNNKVPSLSQDLERLVYSVDLKAAEIKEALASKDQNNSYTSSEWERIERQIGPILQKAKENVPDEVHVDRKSAKLFFTFEHSAQKGIRPQKLVEDILGIKNPVFLMAREKVLFKSSREN